MTQKDKEQECKKCGRVFGSVKCFDVDCPNNTPKITMNPEDKKLLLKDLCTRLPYKVIVDYSYNAFNVHNGNYVEHGTKRILTCYLLDVFISPRQDEKGEYIKPYLFPMSNMTEEQWKEYQTLKMTDWVEGDINGVFINAGTITDWLNKNHFDYRGLIEKGLAIDATGKNIYQKINL